MVPPKGPAFARSASTWIHWWSAVASAKLSIRSCVISSHSVGPNWSPTAPSRSLGEPYVVLVIAPACHHGTQNVACYVAAVLRRETRHGGSERLGRAGDRRGFGAPAGKRPAPGRPRPRGRGPRQKTPTAPRARRPAPGSGRARRRRRPC